MKVGDVVRKKFRDSRRGLMLDAELSASCSVHRDWPMWVHVLDVVGARITHPFVRLVCRLRGHVVVDTSYGTPDHGYEGWHCTRCGAGAGASVY